MKGPSGGMIGCLLMAALLGGVAIASPGGMARTADPGAERKVSLDHEREARTPDGPAVATGPSSRPTPPSMPSPPADPGRSGDSQGTSDAHDPVSDHAGGHPASPNGLGRRVDTPHVP